jgi:pyridoxamine 5'-phosphate oxidase
MQSSAQSDECPGADPLALFVEWQALAAERGGVMPDAFALATATRDGRPSVRTVLFKGVLDGAVRLVTNYDSRKGRELTDNPHGALMFYWPVLDRQVRMEGRLERAPASESDAYFAARDRDSQLGAWASAQSEPVPSRAALLAELDRVRQRFEGAPVPRPPHWGVVHLIPERVELWMAGPHRLHDRFSYTRDGAGWRCQRLMP